MKRYGLIHKLMFTNAMIMFCVLTFLAFILSIWVRMNFHTEKKYQFEQISSFISTMITEYTDNTEIDNLHYILSIASEASNTNIYLLDDNFNDISKNSNVKGYDNDKILKYIKSKQADINSKQKLVDYINENYIYVYPVNLEDSNKYYIVMQAPLSNIRGQLNKMYVLIWIVAIFFIILSTIILSFFANKILITRLSEINKAAKKISNGEVDKRVNVYSNDEISDLANSFNKMAESLEKIENNRREFISNVSHELRTPITAIKGFISGIIDGVIPRDKENYYLNRVYNEINRLTRLVNDLLDLSTIQSGTVNFNFEDIDINEIIKICIGNMEPKILEKKVSIDVKFCSEKLYVRADKDKIIQVIMNLLDNSIKFCDSNNGKVTVSTYKKNNKNIVDIFNNGPKINDEDIDKIWDRFYKTDKSRTDKFGTGLGLSIVRMIILNHDGEIWVENNEKQGVNFKFTI